MRAATLLARAAATVALALCLVPGVALAQFHTDSCNPNDDCEPHPEAFNHAVFVSQSVPTSMIAGQPYAVSVTLLNTGGTTWSSPTYVLYSQNPDGNTTWGLNQVPLPYTVVDDQTVTFSFTVTAPSTPGSYNFQWSMRVNATDFGDAAPNAVVMVVANAAPSVTLTQPAGGAQFAPGDAVTLAATASDSDGIVDRVEFLIDGVEVDEDPGSPYAVTWTATAGNHTVQARAIDNLGKVATTSAITISATNQPPTVSLTAPSDGASFDVGAPVGMAATASDSDGTIDRVEFLVDGVEVGEDAASPYSVSWPATVGHHTVQARAVDNGGATTISGQVAIDVGNEAPSVALTAPAGGSSYSTGATVAMAATASDSDGTVNRVEFLVDGTEVGEDASSPYAYSWTATAGSHTVQARAVDDDGASATTSPINIAVSTPTNQAPSVTLTAPANGAGFAAGDSVALSATASDTDGTVARVEFLVDGIEVSEDLGSPYGTTWTATAGTHTVAARAVDNGGATTTSNPAITITVASAPPPPVSVTRTYTYDSAQRLCRVVEPETGATLMGYDDAGNLAWSASGLPATTACSSTGSGTTITPRKSTRAYDARNRLVTLSFPDLNGKQEWTYFPDGLPDTITTYNDAGGSTVLNRYTYNKRRLPTSERLTAGNSWTVNYGYDNNGNLASTGYPNQLLVAYAPNALGQPTQAGTFATNVTYYPNGAIAGFVYGNGIVHTLTQNARGLPDRSRDADGATSIHDDSYDYDKAGNVLAVSDGVTGARGDRDMAYDDLDRLVSATSPMFGAAAYTYDAIDNLTSVQVTGGNQPRTQDYCYDASNRLTNLKTGGCSTGATVVGLGYDVQGNLANRSGTTFTFDYGNRLRKRGTDRYGYDAWGRRYYHMTAAGTINSLYSQAGQLLYQHDGRSMRRRHYVYLGGSLVAEYDLPMTTSTATVTYQHTDALGSPVATTDAAKAVLQRSEYEPYGALVNRPMEDGPGYTGHATDAATGLVYMQQRYYDPAIGAFLSTDPVTVDSVTGWNFCRYCYAANNPYKFTDPDGRIIDTIADVAFIIYDVVQIARTGATATNMAALGADALGAVIPGVTGGGMAIRAAEHGAEAAVHATSAGKKASTIVENAARGKAGEAATRAKLGDRVAGEQVTFKTSDGTRTRTDFVTKEGGVVETKTGNAQLSSGQAKLKADIEAGRQVTPLGSNATKAGLPSGQPTTMKSCTVDRPGC